MRILTRAKVNRMKCWDGVGWQRYVPSQGDGMDENMLSLSFCRQRFALYPISSQEMLFRLLEIRVCGVPVPLCVLQSGL